VVAGQKVAAGDPVAEIARDPFPRPVLTLTDAVLRPLDEDYHHSLSELRSAEAAHAIAKQELESALSIRHPEELLAIVAVGKPDAAPPKPPRKPASEITTFR